MNDTTNKDLELKIDVIRDEAITNIKKIYSFENPSYMETIQSVIKQLTTKKDK